MGLKCAVMVGIIIRVEADTAFFGHEIIMLIVTKLYVADSAQIHDT